MDVRTQRSGRATWVGIDRDATLIPFDQIVLEMERLHILHVESDCCFARREIPVQLTTIVDDPIVLER